MSEQQYPAIFRKRKKRSSLKIFQSVLFALFMREMQTRFGASRLGVIGMFMEPLIVLVAVFAFYAFFRASLTQGLNFPLFILHGIVPYGMMRTISFKVMEALQANQGLFVYQQIKPFDSFLSRAIMEGGLYLVAYALMLGVMGIWFDAPIGIKDPVTWGAAIFIGIVLSFALGMFFSILGHAMPRLQNGFRLIMVPLNLLSGTVYPIWRMPEKYIDWFAWNPYLHIVEKIREGVFDYYPETRQINFHYPIMCSLILLFISMALYRWRKQQLRVLE